MYSTKGRRPWLKDEGIRQQLYAYKATILRDNADSPALIIGGDADHIHALCLLSRKFAIKDVIEEARWTTKWLKKQGRQYADFHWQLGYGIFSVSESNVEQVRTYCQFRVQSGPQADHRRAFGQVRRTEGRVERSADRRPSRRAC